MSVHRTLFCFFFLSLQAGNSGSVKGLKRFYEVIGNDVTIGCIVNSSGTWKFFCRESCEGENKLIETDLNTAQRGRYRIDYDDETSFLFVSIEHLTTSDSGRYRCGLGRSSYRDFKLVVDALLYGDKEEPFYREAGSSLTVGCSFNFDGSTKYFCRGKGKENVLVQTDGDRVQSDRYSIRYVEALVGGVLYVTISQLTQSDSGRYTCYLDRTGFFDGSTEFTISVTDASTPTTVVTSASTPTTVVTSASTPTTTQSFSSRSGSSTPSASSGTADQSVPPQKEGRTSTDVLLIVGLTLVFTVALLLVALLVFCRRRSSKPLKGQQTVYETVTEGERKDGERAPPAEISTVYSCASFVEATGAETSDDYSLVMAVSPQHKAEEHQPVYTQVAFSKSNSASPVTASRGISDDVVYSVPRVDVSSPASRAVEESLYSNVR